ncbi:hypothetical protein L873DRAFT_1161928 [Choiromyces venosus 120613-1]|uniref:Uncharacterized protein n=1 Tax=Choiromyces venosus 120613-1 TaxID=1336337 RepID=A0A3N4JI80_9PEZI|nr:hypothetical protein L873DRAFT_1161928 [Choiromyces venosus 120613-1]
MFGLFFLVTFSFSQHNPFWSGLYLLTIIPSSPSSPPSALQLTLHTYLPTYLFVTFFFIFPLFSLLKTALVIFGHNTHTYIHTKMGFMRSVYFFASLFLPFPSFVRSGLSFTFSILFLPCLKNKRWRNGWILLL